MDDIHRAIIGGTGSGKTFVAQQWAADFRRAGIGTLVMHKPREPWPAECASWQTPDPERLQAMFWRAKRCAVFMELADAHVNKWDDRFHQCFSEGRHEGHRCFFISQYGPQVHPLIRANCSSLALFATTKKAAKAWAEEFNDEGLMGAVTLPPHMFYFKPSRYQPAVLRKVRA
ncbi:hypothetical protein OPIT5_16665 [Opitutaceae bacterium TAV5]|nr:hypothetical protein OPIT5_16665 [Opitutaceae bacterium TAV5]